MTQELEIVDVISPQREVVDLRPHQILQVIMVDYKNVSWSNLHAHDTARPKLNGLRAETFQCDGFFRPKRINFKLQKWAKKTNAWQSHFWFRFNPNDVQKLERYKSRFELADLKFRSNNALIGELKVNFVMDEEDKEKYHKLLSETIAKGQDPIQKEAAYSGVGGRIINMDQGYLFNPGNEQVVFEEDQESMMLELMEPLNNLARIKYDWKGQKDVASRWDGMELKKLENRFINGQTVHRFIIKNLNYPILPPQIHSKKMGKILFTLEDENNTRWTKHDKKIEVFVTKKREVDDFFISDPGDECLPIKVTEIEEKEEEEDYQSFFQVRKITDKSFVKIDELKSNLGEGVRVIKLKNVKNTRREILNPRDKELIELKEGCDLVISLPYEVHPSWTTQIKGRLLNYNFYYLDKGYQRFVFQFRPKTEHIGTEDEIMFYNYKEKRSIFVRKSKPVYTNEIESWYH